MEIILIDPGYITVRRVADQKTICMGVVGKGKRLHDVSFPDTRDQKCNRTRQAAMKLLQHEGYR